MLIAMEEVTSSRGHRTGTEPTMQGVSAERGTREDTSRASLPNRKLRIQLILAVVLAVFGMILFVVSFVAPPTGIIDSSVLVAGGEAFTFSGSLIGIDYSYKAKRLSRD